MSKQVIVVNKALKMGHGKMAAQVAHASLACLLDIMTVRKNIKIAAELNVLYEERILITNSTDDISDWLNNSFAKVVLEVYSEEQLLEIYDRVRDMNIPCALIRDEGRTVFNGVSTLTCVGIGPADDDIINPVTGKLKLYKGNY
jgi:PTH2 family peptidyl-tRNA hydrolase